MAMRQIVLGIETVLTFINNDMVPDRVYGSEFLKKSKIDMRGWEHYIGDGHAEVHTLSGNIWRLRKGVRVRSVDFTLANDMSITYEPVRNTFLLKAVEENFLIGREIPGELHRSIVPDHPFNEHSTSRFVQHWLWKAEIAYARTMEPFQEFLASYGTKVGLHETFTFPEPIRVACEQYLIYFGQFLADVGIDAFVVSVKCFL